MKPSKSLEGKGVRFRDLFENSGIGLPCMALLLLVTACAVEPSSRPAVTFTEAPSPHSGDKLANWPLPPDVIEDKVARALEEETFELVSAERTATGLTGAESVKLLFTEKQKKLKFKWKRAVPGRLDDENNSPRREIASYEIQKLFLDPEDYVVPTSLIYCVPAVMYAKQRRDVPPLAPFGDCVIGNLSVWLQNVTQPETLYEQERFLKDPNYAYYLANFNLFTFLVYHRDGKASNFLRSKDEDRPQLFAIDNGISFRSFPFNFFATNWNVIRVPALRKESIDRLREIERGQLDALQVVAQLEKNDQGMLISVPAGKSLNPNAGVVVADGIIQFGLSQEEIDELWERIQDVIVRVDSGELPVF